jgi:hypothetical protein
MNSLQKARTPRAFVEDLESGKITLNEMKRALPKHVDFEMVSTNNTRASSKMATAVGPPTTLDINLEMFLGSG